MQSKDFKRNQPELKLRNKIREKLILEGWYVKIIHGNAYQSGLPDLYATHSRYGMRWIEVKLPNMKGSKFTPTQEIEFPKLSANGTPIYILTSDSDEEIRKLNGRQNWMQYMYKLR